MNDTIVSPATEFAGFLADFQARNMATIQRSISLQIAEMQSRISVLKKHLSAKADGCAELLRGFEAIDKLFFETNKTIVGRLHEIAQALVILLIQYATEIQSDDVLAAQVRGLANAFVEAATISRNGKVEEAALSVLKKCRELGLISS